MHPLYREQNVSLNEFQQYTFVDYNNNYIWLSNEELLDVLPLNKNRIVIVPDRTSKNNLIYKSSMYSIGCKLPESLNQTYQFRNISLGELYCEIICLFNSKSKASQEAQRYMELLSLELEVL